MCDALKAGPQRIPTCPTTARTPLASRRLFPPPPIAAAPSGQGSAPLKTRRMLLRVSSGCRVLHSVGRWQRQPPNRDRQRGNTYPCCPSASAYTTHHAHTTSVHSDVWKACVLYLPAERANLHTSLFEITKEGDGYKRGRQGGGGEREG